MILTFCPDINTSIAIHSMHSILHDKYYNIGNSEKYLIQTQCQAKSSGINLPEVYGVSKGLDLKYTTRKQVTKPLVSKVNKKLQMKP